MIYAEFAPHLRTLSFFCPTSLVLQKGSDNENSGELTKSLGCSSKGIQLPKQDRLFHWPLGSKILDLCPKLKRPSSDCICFEFPFILNASAQTGKDQENQVLLDANSLKSLTDLECGTCSQPILNPIDPSKSIFRFADTPSEYWHELLDCWACHKEDYSGLPGQKGGIVLAQKNAILVSTQYVIVHPSNVSPESLQCFQKVKILRRVEGELRKRISVRFLRHFPRYDLADTVLQHQTSNTSLGNRWLLF